MKYQISHGRIKYVSFIIMDIIALICAFAISYWIYLKRANVQYDAEEYHIVIIAMIAIDIIVSFVFDTLNSALRRGTERELIDSLKHTGASIVLLSLFLFSTKQGAVYSRVTVYLAYLFDFVLIFLFRSAWKLLLTRFQGNSEKPNTLLITTSSYASEGLDVLDSSKSKVRCMFITDKTNEGFIRDIPVIVSRKEAIAVLCWEWIEKVYICGPEDMDVPEKLLSECKQMNIPVYTAPTRKSMDFEVIRIRTALQKDDKKSGLSFFEGEHDVPFKIRRLYTIFETEQDNQKGFYTQKRGWNLIFCPFGSIDIIIDNGRKRKTVALNNPSAGLLIRPGIWRETIWKKPGSVLCMAESSHYGLEELHDDYDEYLNFVREKDWSAVVESAELTGEFIL